MDIIALLTAFGLGSMITSIIQYYLNNRTIFFNRKFDEKKEAFVGLLNAYHRAALEQTDEAAKEFAYWQIRCELVASRYVSRAIQRIIDTNDNIAKRHEAHEELIYAMRKDLGIE